MVENGASMLSDSNDYSYIMQQLKTGHALKCENKMNYQRFWKVIYRTCALRYNLESICDNLIL